MATVTWEWDKPKSGAWKFYPGHPVDGKAQAIEPYSAIFVST